MNKLVSKNPVLIFKLGRKIVKAQNGLLFIYYKDRDGKDYEAWRGGNDWYYRQKGTTGMTRMPYDYTTTTGLKFYNSTSKGAVANTYDVVNNMSNKLQDVPVTGKMVSNKSPLWNINYAIDNYINGFKLAQQEKVIDSKQSIPRSVRSGYNDYKASKKVVTRPQKTNNSFYQFGKMGGWKRSIGEGTIDDQESLRMLKEMGMEKYSAGLVLDEINKLFGSNAVKRDNKWGDLSKAGLKGLYENWKLLNPNPIVPTPEPATLKTDEYYQSQKPSNQPSVLPKIEMPYTSTGTYNLDNSRTLKTLGIKDYNSLFNFVERNPGSDIASDLKLRFGETSGWNQLNIENEIGIGGHYGRMNRNALWGYLAGLKDKYNLDYARKLGMMMLGYNKQGGQLVSRNPIVRFKNKKK